MKTANRILICLALLMCAVSIAVIAVKRSTADSDQNATNENDGGKVTVLNTNPEFDGIKIIIEAENYTKSKNR